MISEKLQFVYICMLRASGRMSFMEISALYTQQQAYQSEKSKTLFHFELGKLIDIGLVEFSQNDLSSCMCSYTAVYSDELFIECFPWFSRTNQGLLNEVLETY